MELDVTKLRALYRKNEVARILLDYFANRNNNAAETKVDRILSILRKYRNDLSRGQIIDVFKELEKLDCGNFVSGRRGWPSRFVWSVGIVGLGKVAGGEQQELESTTAATVAQEEVETLSHNFILRPDLPVKFQLPSDLTANEALRLAEFIKALPFGNEEE